MSLMAGFDVVAEVSNSKLLELIMANVTIQGRGLSTPFELMFDASTETVTGRLHLIVSALSSYLNPDDTVTLHFSFINSSLLPPAFEDGDSLTGLSGSFNVTAAIRLDVKVHHAYTILDFSKCRVDSLLLDPTSLAKIAEALRETRITPEAATLEAVAALQQEFEKLGQPRLPLNFWVAEGQDGTISPVMQFARLEVHCISHSEPKKQALGYYGILMAANQTHGLHTEKAETAIVPGNDFAISLSPETFEFLFKAADRTNITEVTLTSLTESFEDGYISLRGSFEKTGFCYEVSGNFQYAVTMKVESNALQSTLLIVEQRATITIDWYCEVAAALGALLFPPLTVALDVSYQHILSEFAASTLKPWVPTDPQSKSLGKIDGAKLNTVAISSEGLTVNGLLSVNVPEPLKPSISIYSPDFGYVVTRTKSQSGTFTDRRPPCFLGEFPFEQFIQQERFTVGVSAVLMGLPLRLEWWLTGRGALAVYPAYSAYDRPISLTETTGEVTLHPEDAWHTLPLPGGTVATQPVRVGYIINANDTVVFSNVPSDGNFRFTIHLRATDPVGNVATTEAVAEFAGDVVEIGGDFYFQQFKCLVAALGGRGTVKEWASGTQPRPEELLNAIHDLVKSRGPLPEFVMSRLWTGFQVTDLRVPGASRISRSIVRPA